MGEHREKLILVVVGLCQCQLGAHALSYLALQLLIGLLKTGIRGLEREIEMFKFARARHLQRAVVASKLRMSLGQTSIRLDRTDPSPSLEGEPWKKRLL